jgi:hypothetical protein
LLFYPAHPPPQSSNKWICTAKFAAEESGRSGKFTDENSPQRCSARQMDFVSQQEGKICKMLFSLRKTFLLSVFSKIFNLINDFRGELIRFRIKPAKLTEEKVSVERLVERGNLIKARRLLLAGFMGNEFSFNRESFLFRSAFCSISSLKI